MALKQRAERSVKSSVASDELGERVSHLELLLAELAGRLRVAVVHGGDKAADGAVLRRAGNPRSWKSYQSVARDLAGSLQRLGFSNVQVIADDMKLASRLREAQVSLAWLNSGGVQGRNAISHTPGMLEMLGVPYVGHDPLTAGLLDSKHHFKRQLQSLGISTAPFFVWSPGDQRHDPLSERRLHGRFAKWPNGFVVKPVTGRASLHVHYVERASELSEVIQHVYNETRNSVLVEGYLAGREYCVAISGPIVSRSGRLWQLPGPFAFSAIERKLGRRERIFTSMDVKPITTARTRSLEPQRDGDVLEALEAMARQVYVGTPLQTLVRLDVRADDRGSLFVLEANPKPDLAAPKVGSTSLICAGLGRYGMNYDDLILSVLANRLAALFDDRVGSVDQFLQSFQYGQVGVRT
jgi:D-alanine-D-alanine ligase